MTPRTSGGRASPVVSTAPPVAMTRGAPTAGHPWSRSLRARACSRRRSQTCAADPVVEGPRAPSLLLEARIQRIGQPVADEVEREDDDEDGQAGKSRRPPR